MKRWKIMQGGNNNGRVFVSSKLPETLQLRLGQWHELFLSCVMLQLFIRSVQSANAKAMRTHPALGYPRARTPSAPRSPSRSPAALFRLLAPLPRLTDAAASRVYRPHGMTRPFAKVNRNIVSRCCKSLMREGWAERLKGHTLRERKSSSESRPRKGATALEGPKRPRLFWHFF
jgi:hypothetical protein